MRFPPPSHHWGCYALATTVGPLPNIPLSGVIIGRGRLPLAMLPRYPRVVLLRNVLRRIVICPSTVVPVATVPTGLNQCRSLQSWMHKDVNLWVALLFCARPFLCLRVHLRPPSRNYGYLPPRVGQSMTFSQIRRTAPQPSRERPMAQPYQIRVVVRIFFRWPSGVRIRRWITRNPFTDRTRKIIVGRDCIVWKPPQGQKSQLPRNPP